MVVLWKGQMISKGGRVTLINSFLSSLPPYFSSFYKAPRKVLDEIIRLQRPFLWNGGADRRSVSWAKWAFVCKPKSCGGLGVKNLELFNFSLLAKWRWRLLKAPEAIWAELLGAQYGDLTTKSTLMKFSLWWRDVCFIGDISSAGSDRFRHQLQRKVGYGFNTCFWLYSLIGILQPKVWFPKLVEQLQKMGAWVCQWTCERALGTTKKIHY